jgi:catechol-2,3-dioxygenase
MKRRAFIGLTASATALAVLESHYGLALPLHPAEPGTVVRITALRLLTASPLQEMKDFYQNVIGFTIENEKTNELTVVAGATRITFVKTTEGRPFYHFAFNIPENKIDLAFEWQRVKTPIVRPSDNRVVHFAHWNAHSIFFLDPAGNLVEYIARHDLKNPAPGKFSVNDILYASEIAFIVDDVNATGTTVQQALDLTAYRPATDGFWPIGDEHGLLLMIRKGRVWASHPNQINKTDVFPTTVHIRSNQKNPLTLEGFPYEVMVK